MGQKGFLNGAFADLTDNFTIGLKKRCHGEPRRTMTAEV